MSQVERKNPGEEEENNNPRPVGAGEEIVIGGKEYWHIPEAGSVVEIPTTSTSESDDSYNPEHDDYVES